MLAHSQGQLLNMNQLANSLGISAPTVRTYIDLFESTFIIRQLFPYFTNGKKRLIKSPKVYFRDSGILHALLGQSSFDGLQSHPVIGFSFEGFVVEQLLRLMPTGWQAFFYRTASGTEIDMVLINRQQQKIAVEVKYSLSPQLNKGFWIAYNELSCKRGYVVYPGKERYSIGKSVSLMPLETLESIFREGK